MDIPAALADVPLFGHLSAEELALLARDCKLLHKKAKQTLVHEGDTLTQCYLLVEGKAQSYFLNPDGKRFVVHAYAPGSCMAITACLGQWRYSGTLEVTEEATLIAVPFENIQTISEINAAFGQQLLHYTLRHTKRLQEIIKDLNFGALARLSRHLFRLALEQGVRTPQGLQLALNLRKNELAEQLGITPETLSRMFSQLQAQNIITVEGQVITVHNLRNLVYASEGLM